MELKELLDCISFYRGTWAATGDAQKPKEQLTGGLAERHHAIDEVRWVTKQRLVTKRRTTFSAGIATRLLGSI